MNNRVMSALKVIFKEAEYRQDIGQNPALGIGLLKYASTERGIFEPKELKDLFKACPGPWDDVQVYTMFLLAASTGMRRGEILALTWDKIDFTNKIIRIDQAWKDEKTLGPPKWGKTRFVPIPNKTAAALEVLKSMTKAGESFVFQWGNDQRLGYTYFSKAFRRGMKNAGIDYKTRNLSPHSFRHTLNSILLGKGYGPDRVRSVLGWSSEKVQGDYTHQVKSQLKDFSKAVQTFLG